MKSGYCLAVTVFLAGYMTLNQSYFDCRGVYVLRVIFIW